MHPDDDVDRSQGRDVDASGLNGRLDHAVSVGHRAMHGQPELPTGWAQRLPHMLVVDGDRLGALRGHELAGSDRTDAVKLLKVAQSSEASESAPRSASPASQIGRSIPMLRSMSAATTSSRRHPRQPLVEERRLVDEVRQISMRQPGVKRASGKHIDGHDVLGVCLLLPRPPVRERPTPMNHTATV